LDLQSDLYLPGIALGLKVEWDRPKGDKGRGRVSYQHGLVFCGWIANLSPMVQDAMLASWTFLEAQHGIGLSKTSSTTE
jgi:hypothetical protein